RADDRHMSDIADMGRKAEGCRAAGLGVEQRRTAKMLVCGRARPDRRQRHQMCEIERMDERLTDIGIDLPRQRAEPGFKRVHSLANAGETEAIDDALDSTDLFLDAAAVGVHYRDCRCQIAERDMIAAKRLKREISI